MKKLVLVLVLFVIMGCQMEWETDPQIKRDKQAATDACISKGGVPIYSSWNDNLINCEFPPTK